MILQFMKLSKVSPKHKEITNDDSPKPKRVRYIAL